jgi:hypothetical protein
MIVVLLMNGGRFFNDVCCCQRLIIFVIVTIAGVFPYQLATTLHKAGIERISSFYASICNYFLTFLITHILELLIDLLGRYSRVVDHLAVKDVAQGAPLGGGSTF